MSRIISSVLFLLCAMSINAQQNYKVGTTEEKKGILFEEFTGVGCSNCPDGHKLSKQIHNGYGDRFVLVNLHAGPFSPKAESYNYTTEEGDEICRFFDATSYPCALINRHSFSENKYLNDKREAWLSLVSRIENEVTPMNLYLESSYDDNSRELKIHVEGYSRVDNSASDMRLNVLFTQDYIYGPQQGTPTGKDYEHMHMVRHFFTPYDGAKITSKAQGEYFTQDYTYVLPEAINKQPVVPGNINIVAFVTSEGMTEVVNAKCVKPEYKNMETAADAVIMEPNIPVGSKYGYNFFEAKIRNKCAQNIKNATFEVTVNGKVNEIVAECNINPFVIGDVKVPYEVDFVNNDKADYELKLIAINGEPVTPTSLKGSFGRPAFTDSNVKIIFGTDSKSNENEFLLKDASGNVLKAFGPYAENKPAKYEEDVVLEKGQIYCVEITDIFGNGLNMRRAGSLETHDSNGNVIDKISPVSGFGARSFFIVGDLLGIDDIVIENQNGDKIFSIGGVQLNGNSKEAIIIKNGKKYINK